MDLAKVCGKMPIRRLTGLLMGLDTLLKGSSVKREPERIAAAKTLVALLPKSLPTIEARLQEKNGRWSYELHFSLFCFLDDALEIPISAVTLKRIPSMVGSYLKSAERDTARAPWMASHLLAQHWPGKQAVHALTAAAVSGKHVVARSAALSGLAERLALSGPADATDITESLRAVHANDPSARLRRRAARILARKASN